MAKRTPAWMLCDDMFTRIKDELILEAVDILHDEIKEKRIDIRGYTALLPDRSQELQRDIFIINNIISNTDEIRGQYKSYVNVDNRDTASMRRLDELKRFLMSVDAINVLMELSKVFSDWAADAGRFANIQDERELVIRSMGSNYERLEALKYVIASKKFNASKPITNHEREVLAEVMASVKVTPRSG